jgi:hypothetical protein
MAASHGPEVLLEGAPLWCDAWQILHKPQPCHCLLRRGAGNQAQQGDPRCRGSLLGDPSSDLPKTSIARGPIMKQSTPTPCSTRSLTATESSRGNTTPLCTAGCNWWSSATQIQAQPTTAQLISSGSSHPKKVMATPQRPPKSVATRKPSVSAAGTSRRKRTMSTMITTTTTMMMTMATMDNTEEERAGSSGDLSS